MKTKVYTLRRIKRQSIFRWITIVGITLLALAVMAVPVFALTLVSETTWGGPDSEVTNGAAVAADG